MIFGWLGKRGGGGKSADTTREFLQMLTGSSAAVLQQVMDWVDEQQEAGDNRLALLQHAEDRLEPVLAEIGGNLEAQRRTGVGHKLLRAYCERFSRAYAGLSRKLPAGSADKQVATVRAVHLAARACRLARLISGDADELRKESLNLFLEAQQQGLTTATLSPYPGMKKTSASQELAVAMLWETAPLDALTLEQVEYLERFLVANGSQIVLKATPGATTSHAVLADGRVDGSGQADASAVLFVGPGPLTGMLAGILKLPDTAPLPAWAGTALPHTDLQTIKALAQRMIATWERKHIKRGSERKERKDRVRVTGGFDNIRRAVAYASYVRSGGQLNAYDTRGRIFTDRMKEVMVGLEEEKRELTPVEILMAMEGAGDSNAVEAWTASDSSEQGYSLVVPGFRSWLAVGGLIAVREENRIDWHVAIVRRMHGGASTRRIGVEILHGKPAPVGVGEEGQTTNLSLADMRDAILIHGEPESWLVTTFACTPDSSYLVAGQHGQRLYRILERSHGNADCQIFRCEPVAGAA